MPRKDPTRPTGAAGLLVLHMDNKDSDENAVKKLKLMSNTQFTTALINY
jgi:hypothetical protein